MGRTPPEVSAWRGRAGHGAHSLSSSWGTGRQDSDPTSTPHLHTAAPYFPGVEVCRTLSSRSSEGATNLSVTRAEPGGPGVCRVLGVTWCDPCPRSLPHCYSEFLFSLSVSFLTWHPIFFSVSLSFFLVLLTISPAANLSLPSPRTCAPNRDPRSLWTRPSSVCVRV